MIIICCLNYESDNTAALHERIISRAREGNSAKVNVYR